MGPSSSVSVPESESEPCGLKWVKAYNKCVHGSIQLANLSPNPCLLWPHYIPYAIKITYTIITVPTPTVAWTRA